VFAATLPAESSHNRHNPLEHVNTIGGPPGDTDRVLAV